MKIVMSRRNLLTLVAKLNRNATESTTGDSNSNCTLLIPAEDFDFNDFGMVMVTAVEDEVKHADRAPGAVYGPDFEELARLQILTVPRR